MSGMTILEDYLRKTHGLTDDFRFVHYEWLKDGSTYSLLMLEGGRCPLLKTGPKKGMPNYRKMTDEQTFYLTTSQIDGIELQYEIDTRNCCECRGLGKKVARVSVADGTTYRVCSKCCGDGKAKG